MDKLKQDLYLIADQMRSIANLGLQYSTNKFDTERYEQITELSARLYAGIEGEDLSRISSVFKDHLNHISPLGGADAVIMKDDAMLLIKRHDDKLWATPGGLIEVGETPKEAAERELFEETNIKGTAKQLIGLFDSRLWNSKLKHHLYHYIFLVEADTSTMKTTDEALEIGFFTKDNLPDLSAGHDKRVPFIFDWMDNHKEAYCD
ncbi:MAG: NUDIX hydrolase N-terminal domain-containing protein [Spirochaetales bacterium]|nr:NUDIX hydrolase N-terminal domain-containing protein [Spirochaetales bacterium]